MRDRLQSIRARIATACDSVGRDPEGIILIVVSKAHPVDAIKRAYDLGIRDFGESRLQEAIPKIEVLPNDVEWHFVGHLQSNKAKRNCNSKNYRKHTGKSKF